MAQAMIEGARGYNRHGDKVSYALNERPDLQCFHDCEFDFVLSVVVLQHMRADYQRAYLAEFLRVLRPGGHAFFQVANAELVPGAAPLATGEGTVEEAHMEMHCLPTTDVQATVAAAGGRILIEEQDMLAGLCWESRHYLCCRERA